MLARCLAVSTAVVAVAGCARPAPRAAAEAPAAEAARDTAAARPPASTVWRSRVPVSLIFRDTTAYRRACRVPPGKPVDLKAPCQLIDQSPGVILMQPPAPARPPR
jgi:hypothetical protein